MGQVARTPQEAQQLEADDWVKCRNPVCQYYLTPEEFQDGEINGHFFSCPNCKLTYPLLDPTPFRVQGGGVVGNEYKSEPDAPGIKGRDYETLIGLTMKQQGDIAEGLVKGLKEIPGYGPITWWSETYNDPIDGGAGEWGIEVKAISIDAKNHRFIPGPRVRKDQMVARAKELGFKGILGMLVILDYRRSVADIYSKEMPNGDWQTLPDPIYPEGRTVQGPVAFRSNSAERLVAEIPFKNPFLNPQNPEPTTFAHTGDDIPF
jgi:hypothetical protein